MSPLIRKVIKIGNSRAVIIPPDWLRHQARKLGRAITSLHLEVDNVITLKAGDGDGTNNRKVVRGKEKATKKSEH